MHYEELHDLEIWYVDMKATKHMMKQKSSFANMRKIELNTWLMTITNNQQLWVNGLGSIKVMGLVKGYWHKHTM